MNTHKAGAAVHPDRPTQTHEPSRTLRRWWRAVTLLLVAGIFAQAIFAGAMLSGESWAGPAHNATAIGLIAATLAAALTAALTLHRIPHGPRLALTLLALAASLLLQTAIGKLSAQGANLMWLHIPLGVALVALAARSAAGAGRLGGE